MGHEPRAEIKGSQARDHRSRGQCHHPRRQSRAIEAPPKEFAAAREPRDPKHSCRRGARLLQVSGDPADDDRVDAVSRVLKESSKVQLPERARVVRARC